MSLEVASQRLQGLRELGVIEVLLLSGEVHPRSPRRRAWIERLYDLAALALEMGFLPHTNAGPLSRLEMERLKQVNVSMGLMLEQMTPAFLETVHRYAPSKRPQVRLQQLMWAGELRIPFTTGLLLGLGETEADWIETLEHIAALQGRYGHIQEVILQPHSPGQAQALAAPALPSQRLVKAVELARDRLPDSIALQIPPNLVDPKILQACLEAGVRDMGGIGPIDEVNPDYAHPTPASLATAIAPGWSLAPRLPVYAQYDEWLPPSLRVKAAKFRQALDSQTGSITI